MIAVWVDGFDGRELGELVTLRGGYYGADYKNVFNAHLLSPANVLREHLDCFRQIELPSPQEAQVVIRVPLTQLRVPVVRVKSRQRDLELDQRSRLLLRQTAPIPILH